MGGCRYDFADVVKPCFALLRDFASNHCIDVVLDCRFTLGPVTNIYGPVVKGILLFAVRVQVGTGLQKDHRHSRIVNQESGHHVTTSTANLNYVKISELAASILSEFVRDLRRVKAA